MKIIETTDLSFLQKEEVMALWNKEYPVQLKFAQAGAFDAYLQGIGRTKHVMNFSKDNRLLGWAFLFERDSETWFAIIVDQTVQKQGLGTQLLNALKAKATLLNGWVIDHEKYVKDDGTGYLSPMPFYLKRGFHVLNAHRLETEKLSAVKISWIKD